jgi:D-alanyl-D-alanine dipeptidase
VSVQAQANRKLLADAMRRNGFDPYKKEWWHFTLKNEPFRDTYFDFPVR